MSLRSAAIAAGLIAATNGMASSQPPQAPQAPMVIEPADADAFREIIETTIPPRYNGALIRWYAAILQRQQQQAKQQESLQEIIKAAKEKALKEQEEGAAKEKAAAREDGEK